LFDVVIAAKNGVRGIRDGSNSLRKNNLLLGRRWRRTSTKNKKVLKKTKSPPYQREYREGWGERERAAAQVRKNTGYKGSKNLSKSEHWRVGVQEGKKATTEVNIHELHLPGKSLAVSQEKFEKFSERDWRRLSTVQETAIHKKKKSPVDGKLVRKKPIWLASESTLTPKKETEKKTRTPHTAYRR